MELKTAADAVAKCGKSIRSAAAEFNVDRMTLSRFMVKLLANPEKDISYERCKTVNMNFSTAMEADLAIHAKDMARRFYGLSKENYCYLVYEYAERNNVNIPENWRGNKKVGQGFWLRFKSRHNLAFQSPEPTSLARETSFNRHTVRKFFLI